MESLDHLMGLGNIKLYCLCWYSKMVIPDVEPHIAMLVIGNGASDHALGGMLWYFSWLGSPILDYGGGGGCGFAHRCKLVRVDRAMICMRVQHSMGGLRILSMGGFQMRNGVEFFPWIYLVSLVGIGAEFVIARTFEITFRW